jgi:hypothetical protein
MVKSVNCPRRNTKYFSPRFSKERVWLLAVILTSVGGWGCSPGEDALRQQHASVLSQAESLRLPVNMSSEELGALERVGPLLDSVKLELGG